MYELKIQKYLNSKLQGVSKQKQFKLEIKTACKKHDRIMNNFFVHKNYFDFLSIISFIFSPNILSKQMELNV